MVSALTSQRLVRVLSCGVRPAAEAPANGVLDIYGCGGSAHSPRRSRSLEVPASMS